MSSTAHAWRPEEIRRKQFTVRMRGLDSNEVRGFLNLLADDVHRLQEQVSTLKRDSSQAQDELTQSRAELQQLKSDVQNNPHGVVTDQAVELLNQAQQLADALIDESMQSARDMMMAARSHQKEVITSPAEIQLGTGLPGAEAGDNADDLDAVLSAETGGVRPAARVTQAQFRAVLDALNEQITRLGTITDGDGPDAPADLAAARSGAANGRRT